MSGILQAERHSRSVRSTDFSVEKRNMDLCSQTVSFCVYLNWKSWKGAEIGKESLQARGIQMQSLDHWGHERKKPPFSHSSESLRTTEIFPSAPKDASMQREKHHMCIFIRECNTLIATPAPHPCGECQACQPHLWQGSQCGAPPEELATHMPGFFHSRRGNFYIPEQGGQEALWVPRKTWSEYENTSVCSLHIRGPVAIP